MRRNGRPERATWVRLAVVFVILAGFFVNTVMMYRTISQVVQQYILESNRQIAGQITYRIQSGMGAIGDFAEMLSLVPEYPLTRQRLEEEAKRLDLNQIFLLKKDDDLPEQKPAPAQKDEDDLYTWARKAGIWKEPKVSVWNEETLLLSAPVIRQDKTVMVVVGVESYQDIYQSVRRHDSWQGGVRMLLNKHTHQVLMMARGQDAVIQKHQIQQLLGQMKEENYSQLVKSGGLFGCVTPVENTDWLQVSLIHIGTLMSTMSRHVAIYFALILVAFLLLVGSLVWTKGYLRKWEGLFMKDALTGGLNREGFLKKAAQYREENHQAHYSVVWMNLCEFRSINSVWGEEEGNDVLRFIYKSLAADMASQELLCRSPMDRFVLLMDEPEDQQIAQRLERVVEQMNRRIAATHEGFLLRFAIGACHLAPGEDVTQAISNATYVGKKSDQKNQCAFYNEQIRNRIMQEHQCNELFESSLKNRDFQVYLQPKVNIQGEGPCQAEALVRWIHPDRGMIYPDTFIPLFERNGKICQLDLYMFEEVCRLLSAWRQEGKPLPHISVNVSRFHLRSAGSDVWKAYKQIKEQYQIPDGLVEIELTETMLIDLNHMGIVREILRNFRSSGFLVALDDFGLAYSSLALLKEFELDTMKLDRSFFIDENKKSDQIVHSLIQLAHSLDLQVVAEGIEEQNQVESLRQMGCDFVQGYVFAKPMPVAEFEKWRENYGR